MAVAGGTQGGGGSGGGGASSGSSSSADGGGGGGGGSASVPGCRFSASSSPSCCSAVFSPHPPPTARPPASALHHLRFTGSPYLRRSVGTMAHGRGISLPSFRPGREGGPLDAARVSARSVGLAVWLRGEAATSCFPAPPLMLMLLSGRRNRQWDRSPSSAFTSLAAGARSPHLRMGGSTHR